MDWELALKNMNTADIKKNVNLKMHSSYRIGGPAKYYYELHKIDDFVDIVKFAKKENVKMRIIGSGTNILFPDDGLNELVIKMQASNISFDKNIIAAEAGALLSIVILKAKKAGYDCIQPLMGLPGTIGGAIYGNAGAFGKWIADFVDKVSVFDPNKKCFYDLDKEEIEFGYRTSAFKKNNLIICKAYLKLKKNCDVVNDELAKVSRLMNQPTEYSCGCFFKNPSGAACTASKNANLSAGKLIDEAGLKNYSIGGAKVSDKHANFIINTGNATQKDVLAVSNHVKKVIKQKYGITLEEEVQIIS